MTEKLYVIARSHDLLGKVEIVGPFTSYEDAVAVAQGWFNFWDNWSVMEVKKP